MNTLLSKCPVCGSQLEVSELHCNTCDTTITGHFSAASGPFAQLSPEQVQFVLTFVRSEGRLNRVGDELDISYPTVRNRLFEVIRALGYEPGKEETPPRMSIEERKRILDELDQGKITPDQARRMLQGQSA
ncbi:MAG TPA: DUF2089 domain-containing protein [Anaerolineaceae bacterium]|nr:DUF2089 domain-containing protein [Anaerolineaceae bacterium]